MPDNLDVLLLISSNVYATSS